MRAMSFGSLLFSCSVLAVLSMNSFAAAADGADRLPGDRGRMAGGVLPSGPPPGSGPGGPPMMPHSSARAPAIALAVEAAQAIAAGCKQYASLGIAVVNAAGEPVLMYLPDGSEPSHGYTAIRKAYTAAKLKTDTTALVEKAQKDSDFAATIKADPNLMAFHGGLLLQVGGEVIGAIGVSGAEPGGHDDECGTIGLNKIKDRLK
jgi:uncharacterized protein GlcG (DUF336 family)